ncbi:transglutaminase family protein [Skermania piniformis]|uniref:Transglutaminase family protein n=1 Tax=Skermania pinensis TaxID=39122 RepID=A0ABX8S8F9_9ACTN|nr:transglutaminase family protein [Skermania piniformis]QXQ14154.1 transglutaminase family protein [Skermania piniformis]
MSRRYRVLHRTSYSYDDVVTNSYGRAYLTPRDIAGQQRLHRHRVKVEPAPTDEAQSPDVYGNLSSYFQVTSEHWELVVTSESVVEVQAPAPGRLTEGAALRPWEEARPTAADGARAVEFVLDLVPAEITPEVRAYAADVLRPGRPIGEAVADLTARIFADFTYTAGSTTVSTKVADVFAARHGVCQDFARLAIACLRSQGLAARYVSGYLATDPPPGREHVFGIDATHAWAAVRLPDDTWLAFDPTNNQFVGERYVTVGWGRDYVDVPPLRGIIYSDSTTSTIAVSVDVAEVSH